MIGPVWCVRVELDRVGGYDAGGLVRLSEYLRSVGTAVAEASVEDRPGGATVDLLVGGGRAAGVLRLALTLIANGIRLAGLPDDGARLSVSTVMPEDVCAYLRPSVEDLQRTGRFSPKTSTRIREESRGR